MFPLCSRTSVRVFIFALTIGSARGQFIEGGQEPGTVPTWTTDIGQDVLWMRSSTTGVIIVCTTSELSGIHALTGTKLWSIPELAACSESGFDELGDSPFFTATPTPWRGAAPAFTREQALAGQPAPAIPRASDLPFVVNALNGTVVFAADTTELSIANALYPLMDCGAFVIAGMGPRGAPTLLCLDNATGRTLWTKSGEFAEPQTCLNGGPHGILIGTHLRLMMLDARSGKELWSRSADPAISKGASKVDKLHSLAFISPYHPGVCFQAQQRVVKKTATQPGRSDIAAQHLSTAIQGWSLKDGQPIWAEPAEFQGTLGNVVPLQNGILVGSVDNGAFILLDPRTGRSAWPSLPDGDFLKAPMTAAVSIDEGTLVCSGKKEVMVFLFDREGRRVWDDPVLLGGPLLGVLRVSGLVRLSSHEQSETRRTKQGPPLEDMRINAGYALNGIRGEHLVALDKVRRRLLLSSNDHVKQLDLIDDPNMTSTIADAHSLEVLPDGYFLEYPTGVTLFGLRGELMYSKTQGAAQNAQYHASLFNARQQLTSLSERMRGAADRAMGSTLATAMVNPAQLTPSLADDLISSMFIGNKDLEYANAMRPRLLAASSPSPIHFMIEHSEGSPASVVAIRKSNGGVAATVALGKDKPHNYAVDLPFGTVVVAEGKYLRGYSVQ